MIDSQAFNQQLADGNTALAPTYLFYGQTPFLSDENAQLLVETAKAKGFSQREIHYIDNKSKFQPIINSLQSPGLFDPKKIIELRFDSEKPSEKIGENVAKIAQHQSTHLVIIQAGGIAYQSQKTKWFTAITQCASTVVSKPIYASQLPNWIHQRATLLNLPLETEALKTIMRYSEGNLLWTNQILMQLAHSDYPRPITVDVVENMLADLSVFQIDDLTQALFSKSPRALKIAEKLEQENESLVLITSILSSDFDNLKNILHSGQPFSQACKTLRIWQNKQRQYQTALNHYDLTHIEPTLSLLALLDKINKGQHRGDGWLLLTRLVSQLVTTT